MLLVYIYVALALYNRERLTIPMGSVETIVDEVAQTAVIDSKGRMRIKSVKEGTRGERKVDREGRLRWREIWNEGSDAVLDVPLGGVCEILYGEGREDTTL